MVSANMQAALLAVVATSAFWQSSFAAPIPQGRGKGSGSNRPRPLPSHRPASNVEEVVNHPDTQRLAAGLNDANAHHFVTWSGEVAGRRAHAIHNANAQTTNIYAQVHNLPQVQARMNNWERTHGANPNALSGAIGLESDQAELVADDGELGGFYPIERGARLMRQAAGQAQPAHVHDVRGTNTALNQFVSYEVGPNQYVDRNGIPSNAAGQRIRNPSHLPEGARLMSPGLYYLPHDWYNSVIGRTYGQELYYFPGSATLFDQDHYNEWRRSCGGRKRDDACAKPDSPPDAVDAKQEKWYTTKYGGGKIIYSNFGRFAKPTDADPNRVLEEPAPVEYISTATWSGDSNDPGDATFENIQMDDSTLIKNPPNIDKRNPSEIQDYLNTYSDNTSKATNTLAAAKQLPPADPAQPDDNSDPNKQQKANKPANNNGPADSNASDSNDKDKSDPSKQKPASGGQSVKDPGVQTVKAPTAQEVQDPSQNNNQNDALLAPPPPPNSKPVTPAGKAAPPGSIHGK